MPEPHTDWHRSQGPRTVLCCAVLHCAVTRRGFRLRRRRYGPAAAAQLAYLHDGSDRPSDGPAHGGAAGAAGAAQLPDWRVSPDEPAEGAGSGAGSSAGSSGSSGGKGDGQGDGGAARLRTADEVLVAAGLEVPWCTAGGGGGGDGGGAAADEDEGEGDDDPLFRMCGEQAGWEGTLRGNGSLEVWKWVGVSDRE